MSKETTIAATRTIFNAEALVKVQIVDKKVSRHVEYRPASSSFFGLFKEQEGFYLKGLIEPHSPYTREQLVTGQYPEWEEMLNGFRFIVEDNIVYYLPYVELTFAGGTNRIVNFNTYSEALAYGNDTANKGIKAQLEF